ncbi:LysR family transcriptional regulator ArgP [Dyella sp.]|uniref:LysR family transcriptional regulator ArgP n=1 Tax=Dyella sp. TaxID=1869338 RepID=UPI002ED0771A
MSLIHPQLVALHAVIEEGSFEKAARRLSLTPSAISQRIKTLEDRLGQVLVLRQVPCRTTIAGARLLRGVQQMRLLEREALETFAEPLATREPIAIAVNADSLATWLLDAIAGLHEKHGLLFDIHVEDQDHSTALLRNGSVMGAVTSDALRLQGCHVHRLGTMRYLPVASPSFVKQHFSEGLGASSMSQAPMLVFNRKDDLQRRFIRSITRAKLAPPIHYIPSPHAFVGAAEYGLGWGMAPESMAKQRIKEGTLCAIAPRRWLDVPLFWQHWALQSHTLDLIATWLDRAAKHVLR